jgi:hypothetical protein
VARKVKASAKPGAARVQKKEAKKAEKKKSKKE